MPTRTAISLRPAFRSIKKAISTHRKTRFNWKRPSVPAPARTDPSPLQGTWHLLRREIACSDERPSTLPFGPDAFGLIVYADDG